MRDNRLKLVVPDSRTKATTDGPTESSAAASPDSSVRRLRLMGVDVGAPPDDAA